MIISVIRGQSEFLVIELQGHELIKHNNNTIHNNNANQDVTMLNGQISMSSLVKYI